MADLTQTAASVVASSKGDKRTIEGILGATVTAGMPLYRDTADNNRYKACDALTATKAACEGIALNGGAAGQPVEIVVRDPELNVGGTLAIGQTYVVSATSGLIALESDITAGQFVTILGVAIAANKLNFSTGAQMRGTVAHA